MLEHDANLHLQRLQKFSIDIVAYGLLRLGTSERDVALLEEDRDVPSCNLPRRVQLVLDLAEPLSREA